MKIHLFRTTISAAIVAMLAACGGGGGSDVGSDIVKISFSEPQGVLEAGRLVTVTGRAVSQNGKLDSMNWTLSGAGAGASAATITNADCADVNKGDSSFGAGSSNWSCTVTLLAPKNLAEPTTYELGLSASGANYSGRGSTKVTVKPASMAINPVQVQIGAVPSGSRAGEAINISGTVSSNASKVSGARWNVVYTGKNQASAFPVPVLENADCAEKTETVNPSGQESSTLTCPVRMIVSPRLQSAADYKLTLVGTNANGFSTSTSVDVPVNLALAVSNKVSVVLGSTATTARGGDKITLRGTIKSTDSKIDLEKSHFSVLNLTPVNPNVGVIDTVNGAAPGTLEPLIALSSVALLEPTNCVRVTVNSGTVKDEVSCSTTMTISPFITSPVTVTYALQGVDDEENYNYESADITVQSSGDAFGSRTTVGYAPVPVVPGSPVNLTCSGQGTGPFTYSWRVANSNGTIVNLSSATTTTGNASFNAPAPLVDTDVVVECGVANGPNVTYTPLTVRIPGSTSPLGFRADVNATPNPVEMGDTVNLTCQGLGVNNANYTYGWKVLNSSGTGLSTVTSAGPTTGAASFVAPAIPAGSGATPATSVTIGLACTVSDGTRVIEQPLDVIINR